MPLTRKEAKPPPRRPSFRPFITVSAVKAAPPNDLGSVIATLRYSTKGTMTLLQHLLVGAPCRHEPNRADLDALDALIERANAIGGALRIPVHIKKEKIADLYWDNLDPLP